MPDDAIIIAETEKQNEQKDNERFKEINKVPEVERTEEQKKELIELKERYGKKMQKRIDVMHAKTLEIEAENEKLHQEIENLKSKSTKEEKSTVFTPNVNSTETVEIASKKYFTDKALIAQIKNGEITEEEAYAYQRKRDREEDREILRKEHEEENRIEEEKKSRVEDAEWMGKNYPQWNKKHPDFNPDDPLYKLANELYKEAYGVNPKGLSLAVKRAKEILRISDEKIDRSDEMEIDKSMPPERKVFRDREVTLSENEKEAAIRIFTRGDVINPKTNRPYTANEAVVKALAAKKARSLK